MSDLADFLLARIAEDTPNTDRRGDASRWEAEPSGLEVRNPQWNLAVAYTNHQIDGYHIARWDPARVLAECESKRQTIERITHYLDNHISDDFSGDWLAEDLLRVLALPYAGHPDYLPEWAPS